MGETKFTLSRGKLRHGGGKTISKGEKEYTFLLGKLINSALNYFRPINVMVVVFRL